MVIKDNGEQDPKADPLMKKRRRFFIVAAVVIVLIISFIISQCSGPSEPQGSDTPGSHTPSQSAEPSQSSDDSEEPTDSEETPSESKTPSKPLPGENRPIVKDPNGKTVWDRYRPNRQPIAPGVTGYGGWGNVFWPTQKKPNEIIAPDTNPPYKRMKITSPHNREDKALTKQGVEIMVELLNINTRDYASLECGMSATRNGTGSFVRDMGKQCRTGREPSLTWESMQNRGIILYVSRIEDWAEGQYSGFYDTPTNAFRGYTITLSAADQNGRKMYSVPPIKYLAYASFGPVNGRYKIDTLKLVKDR